MIAYDRTAESVYQAIAQQVISIAELVSEKKGQVKDSGLLGGKAGIAILFAYLSEIFPERKYLQDTFDLLEDLEQSLSNDVLNYNMSSGVAGIAFTFQHLRNMGVLDPSNDLNLSELDEFVSLGVDVDFRTLNWDPLHGITGLGIYFLERHRETGEKKYLERIVDHLAKMRTEVGEYKIWITPGYKQYSNDNYNFGMAHGMPGVLSFLAQTHRRGIKQHEIEEMICSCLPFLLQCEYRNDEEYCFPNSIDVVQQNEKQKPGSRLAWCYGDLCMANALIHCGTALNRNDWKTKGIDVALKTTQRNFESAGCMDAPFCHGTVGLVHQYNRLYRLTGNDVFSYAAEKWIRLTLQNFYKPGEGAGGYFFRHFNDADNLFEYVPQYGLLEGSAGIALVYLSWLYNVRPDWDVIFLTNV
jgi:class I lanthipeptide synthase